MAADLLAVLDTIPVEQVPAAITRLSADGTKSWVITEADRSATTLLLPDEY